MITKTILDNTVSRLDRKIVENKTKNKSIENELKKLKTFDLSYFIGKSNFEEDGAQNYLVFQPIFRHFKKLLIKSLFHHGNLKNYLTKILHLMPPLTIGLTPLIDYSGSKVRVKFNKGCLKQ